MLVVRGIELARGRETEKGSKCVLVYMNRKLEISHFNSSKNHDVEKDVT